MDIPYHLSLLSCLLQLFSSGHQTQSSPIQSSYNLIYNLADETPSNALIGNLANSLSNELHASVTFVLMTSAKFQFLGDFFHLSSDGDLTALRHIDRDSKNDICGPLDCCHLMICQIEAVVVGHFLEGLPEKEGNVVRQQSPASPNQLTVHVFIRINDANDNAPRFLPSSKSVQPDWESSDLDQKSYFTVYLRENDLSGVETLPIALDDDSRSNGVVEYRLIQYNDNGTPVAHPCLNVSVSAADRSHLLPAGPIESASSRAPLSVATPKLIQLRPLDYESRDDRQIYATLLAIDGGTPALTGSLSLVVHLLDINDNAPEFNLSPSDVYIRVKENSTLEDAIVTVKATDADSGENGQVTYAFSPLTTVDVTSRFAIDAHTGAVRIRQALDYEIYSERNFVLPVVAKDAGSPQRSSTMSIFVTVLDVNDNQPNLLVQENVTVPEGELMTKPVLKFYIKDDDEVSQGKVMCRAAEVAEKDLRSDPDFMAGSRHLRLHAISKTVFFVFTKGVLDYEDTPRASILLSCVDLADSESDSEVRTPGTTEHVFRITVAVGDRNDNAPQFERDKYFVQLPEHAEPGTFVIQVSAVDADSGEFGLLSYKLGLISSMPRLQTDSPPGSASYDHQLGEQAFIIAPDNGRIEVLRSELVDREVSKRITVQVLAQDKGGLVTTAELVVELTDINDCLPNLVGSGEFILMENQRVDTVIGRLHFVDSDEGKNSRIHVMASQSMGIEVRKHIRLTADPLFQYIRTESQVANLDVYRMKRAENGSSLIPRQTWQTNHITEYVGEGEVRVLLVSQMPVDREMYATLFFEVVTFDEGDPVLSTTMTITIHIGDENDNDPSVNFPSQDTTVGYHPPIYANSPKGTSVTKLRASDPDQGENGTIVFHISSATNGSDFFSVNQTSGEIVTAWTPGLILYGAIHPLKSLQNNTSGGLQHKKRQSVGDAAPVSSIHEPLPGLYYLEVVVSDTGVNSRQYLSRFYIHVGPKDFNTLGKTESAISFPFRTFMQKSAGRQLMLALFIIVAFLMVVLLISIIVWVKLHRERRKSVRRLKNIFSGDQLQSDPLNRTLQGSNPEQYFSPSYTLGYPYVRDSANMLNQPNYDSETLSNFTATLIDGGYGEDPNLKTLYTKSVPPGRRFADTVPRNAGYLPTTNYMHYDVDRIDNCLTNALPLEFDANFVGYAPPGLILPHSNACSSGGNVPLAGSPPVNTLLEVPLQVGYHRHQASSSTSSTVTQSHNVPSFA